MVNVQQNARAKNSVLVGNNEKFFDEWKQIIAVNDGKRRCGAYVVSCHDQPPGFEFSQKTIVDITNTKFDITNIRKGFMTARIESLLTISGLSPAASWADPDHLAKAFVGYKASVQAIDRLAMYCNGHDLRYNNTFIPEEGFCYASLRSWSMRDRKRYIHTLYETVRQYLPNVAGTYINLIDFADGLAHPVTIELNIPVVDLLVLQCFDKWVNDMGSLALEMYFTHLSMVFATCDAKDVLENKVYLQDGAVSTATLAGDTTKFTHAFTQIGDPCRSYITSAFAGTTTTLTVGSIIPTVSRCRMLDLKSTIRGYGITDAAKSAIMRKLVETPLRIPAQEVKRVPFQAPPDENGINASLNVTFPNVSCVGIVFPKTDKQLTVFENPMLHGLQIKIAGEVYPNERYSTIGPRFLQEQLIIADLDGMLQATEELTTSYVSSKNKEDGTPYANRLSDDTSFIALFQTERGDAGYTFDGLNFKNPVSFELLASPIHSGANNTYLYPVYGGPRNTRPPVAYLCQDTYFVHDGVQFTYHKERTPDGVESDPKLY